MSDDPIGDALRADADDARAEIKAAGIICPSCGVNAADLPRCHYLKLDHGGIDWAKAERRPATAKCQDGTLVTLPGPDDAAGDGAFAIWQAAASVNLLDEYNKSLDAAFSAMLGWDINGEPPPPREFGGLLEVLDERLRGMSAWTLN